MQPNFDQFLDQELQGSNQRAKDSRWFDDSTRIAFFSLIFSITSLIVTSTASTVLYFLNRAEDKEKRSVTEIARVYDKDFAISLSKILDHAYSFIENDKTNELVSKIRFEKFWVDADADADMLLISSRLKAIDQCLEVDDCDREELFSRFPETVYQAIFFLREFVFLNNELERYATASDLEGWWMGYGEYKFLADYCAWATKKFHGMNLWSIKHERLRSRGEPLPGPCFPPSGLQ